MTGGECLAELRIYLNESSAGFYNDTDLYKLLNDGQNLIMRMSMSEFIKKRLIDRTFKIPYWETLHTLDATVTTTVGSTYQEYNLPSNYLITDYAEYDSTGGTDRQACLLKNFTDILHNQQNVFDEYTFENPAYYIRATKIGFFPQPSGAGAGAYNHYYFKKPTAVTSSLSGTELDLRVDSHPAIVLLAYHLALLQDNRPQEAQLQYNKAMEILQ